MKTTYLFFALCIFTNGQHAIAQESSFNNKVPPNVSSSDSYSFIVGGHLYGKQNSSFYPAYSLTSNSIIINESNASFFIGLGDLVRESDSLHFGFFKELFTDNLNMPFYNAVGNHDTRDRSYYQRNFGQTYWHFTYSDDLFVILDTELDSGRISGPQLRFLENVLSSYSQIGGSGKVFIFFHKLIWNRANEFKTLFGHCNQPYTFLDSNYFESELLTLFAERIPERPLYFFAGDIGTRASFSLFYHQDEQHNITYIGNGLGDTEDDALVKVIVEDKKDVRFELISLSTKKFKAIENYDLEFWNKRFSKDKKTVKKNLMLGFFVVGVSCLLILLVLIKRKKKKVSKKQN